ncbi:MAG: hypothetical protein DME33_02280 [Verrucomicrobia bacterium]|nr:MAG: hypothetical protein DME33_02280 [Verrucomicrobiota bacterium]
MWRAWSVLSITAIALVGVQNARPAETPAESAEVEEVTVTAGLTGSLTSASPEESAKQKTQVTGGFTLRGADEMKLGRASNFEDLLQRREFFFNRRTAPKFPKFRFAGRGSPQKTSRSV